MAGTGITAMARFNNDLILWLNQILGHSKFITVKGIEIILC